MGYFSKCCAKTHLPVVVESLGIPHLNNVVALLPDGRKFEGSYDGYGRVNGIDLLPDGYVEKKWDALKFVLKGKYEGETYKQLGKSGDELAQGYFMSDRFLLYCMKVGSFASYAEYKKAMHKYGDWL